MKRRTMMASGFALASAANGCLGVLTGQEALTAEASPATVGRSTLGETGYESSGSSTERIERTVEVAGQERDVVATNAIERYHRALTVAVLGDVEAGVFATVATPAFEIAGRAVSPVARMDNEELASLMQKQYSDVSIENEVDEASVATLGTTMDVSTFAATARLQGESVDVLVHVGKVQHGGDFVIVGGVYPEAVDGEGKRVLAMIRGLEHEA